MSAESEIRVLADFIMGDVQGEPSQDEGAGTCAVRIIRNLQSVNKRLILLGMIFPFVMFVAGTLFGAWL